MPAIMVKLECLTNMHVGNGDINYNIIDNEVERDPITQYPTINSSGVKGALREYFNRNIGSDGIDEGLIETLFGSDKSKNNTQGALKILSADMIALPFRASAGKEPYYLVTTEEALNNYETKWVELIGSESPNFTRREVSSNNGNRRSVEGKVLSEYTSLFGKELHIMPEESFRKLSLPVMARNHLENGISKNLWYEEVVPHESIFCFAVLMNDADDKAGLMDKFKEAINGKVIQFGGNASIGYGLCKVKVLGGDGNE